MENVTEKTLRLDAYYYGFDPTGAIEIDRILSAVACAGKAYHHTESWTDETALYEPFFRGKTPVDWIQSMATDAAAVIAALKAERDELKAIIDLDADMKEAFAEPDDVSPEASAEATKCIDNFRNIDMLKECLAWVAHWELDQQSGLCPTPDSLSTLQMRITERLAS